MNKEITSLIKKYAEVYILFEEFQKKDIGLLPGGDQKTGVIGEYYAKCFVDKSYKVKAKYAESGKSFDLEYTKNNKTVKIQVKAVSEHSKSRVIAPLSLFDRNGNPAFDQLFLIYLNKKFQPVSFYINSYGDIIKKAGKGKLKIQGSKMKVSDNTTQGSAIYDLSKNLVDKLKDAISCVG